MRERRRWGSLAAGILLPVAAVGQPVPVPPPAPPPISNPIEQIAPRPVPRLQPSLAPPPAEAQAGPQAGLEVRIGTLRITGNEAMSAARLDPAVAGLAGAVVPLSRIEEARLAILLAYRSEGYPFTAVNAGLARQPDGTIDLSFAVTEGFIAEVKIDGDQAAIGPVATQVLRFLERLLGQRPITGAALERALLLASDIPGISIRGTLRPLASEPGALQLVAQVERKAYSGYANIDNRGYKLTGPWQGLFVIGANSFTEFGERTELSLFGAPHSAQWFGQGSLESFVGGSGLRVRVYGGTGETRPTGALRALGYYGQTDVGGISANYPVIRSRPFNLYAVGNFDLFDNTVDQGTAINSRPRVSHDSVRTFRMGADTQLLETWLPYAPAAATTTASLRFSQGIRALGATQNGYQLSGRSGSEDFGFQKISGEVQRTQPVLVPFEGAMLSLQGLFAGQWSDAILPQSEKFYLGGNRLGRGYYSGQITGDRAWGLSLELQLDLPPDEALDLGLGLGPWRWTNQLYLFHDEGRTVENRAVDPNRRIASWGGGLRTVFDDRVQFDVEGVHRIVRQPDGIGSDLLKETAIFFRTLVRF